MDNITYYRSEYLEIIQLKNKPIMYSEHNHVSMYTIGLVIEGDVTLKCDGKSVAFSSNSFFVVEPYQIHALLLPESYYLLSLCIHKDFVTKHKPNDVYDMLATSLSQLYPTVSYTLLAKAINALYKSELSQSFDSEILASARILWQSPENNIRLQEIADKIYLSKFHYIKRFKQNIGMTPHKFQMQNKVRRAQRMIEKDKSLAAIATDLGFYDQSHFIKCFKNIVGLTPTEYKQSFKNL